MQSVIFFISVCGYFLFYSIKVRKHPSLFPVLFISFVSPTLFFFGLANKLPAGVMAINVSGILLGAFSILFVRKDIINDLFRPILFPSVVFFAIGLIWIFCITRNVGISHWDDYTHWYRICKMMYAENAFPTKRDLMYRSYPPGTGLFIYYVTKNISFSADNCLFAQACINLSCCTAFFSFLKTNRNYKRSVYYASFFLIGIVSIVLCSMNISTYSLLVDTTMPLVALSLVFLIYSSGKEPDRADFLLLLFGISFLCLIKTSAIIFALIIIVTFGWFGKKSGSSARKMIIRCAALLTGAAALPVLYNIYSNRIYGNTFESPQAVSLSHYAEMLVNRPGTLDIVRKFLSEIFLIGKSIPQVQLAWLLILLCSGIAVCFKLKGNNELSNRFRKVGLNLCAFFAVYALCLLMIYICTMNEKEANLTTLASFYRYIGSATVFMFGYFVYFCMSVIHEMKYDYLTEAFSLLSMVILLIGSGMFHNGYIWGHEFHKPVEPYDSLAWKTCQVCVPENMEYTDSSYAVIYDDEHIGGYPSKIGSMMECYLRSTHIALCTLNELEEIDTNPSLKNQMASCDYLVVLGDYPEAVSFFSERIPIEYISDCMLYGIKH